MRAAPHIASRRALREGVANVCRGVQSEQLHQLLLLKVSAKTLNFNPETFLEKCNNITEGYHLSDNNGLADTNEKFDDKSWFWNKIKKSSKYYSIEVYGLDFSEISKLHLLAKNKLAS